MNEQAGTGGCMSKTLIVYHSRSGYTRRVAQALARRLGADLDEIRIVQPMNGAMGYLMCAIEAIAGLTPALRPLRKDPADYELVVVGTPVWFWSPASPVRSWLMQHGRLRGRVAFFCTMGGSGAARAFAAMTELAGKVPAGTLALADRQIDAGADDRIDAFAQSIRQARSPRRARAPGGAARTVAARA
jgi:flavodoxin